MWGEISSPMKNRNRKVLDYKNAFETLSPKMFLGIIFFTPRFTQLLCSRWDMDYSNKIRQVSQLFNYYHEDDLYEFFRINHSLHKDKSKDDYLFQLFILIQDLLKDISPDDFVELKGDLIAPPTEIYIDSSKHKSYLVNISREFFVYGFYVHELKKRHGYDHPYLMAALKKIYQRELLPIDISLQPY